MYEFPEWTDAIAAVTTAPEYQNATVVLVDPENVVSTYDIDTGVEVVTDNGVFWTGQARVAPIRWGVNRENTETANANTEKSVRVQFPKNQNFGTVPAPVYRVKRGIKMYVTACDDNPVLLTYVFVCTADVQGSNVASRTIEFAVDGDAVVSDSVLPVVVLEGPTEYVEGDPVPLLVTVNPSASGAGAVWVLPFGGSWTDTMEDVSIVDGIGWTTVDPGTGVNSYRIAFDGYTSNILTLTPTGA
ncbi:MAG: hypothetical protein M0R66_02690 [Candidatus Omnitrophica bacterium]|jgi:hypothetical protein|nr:hypothetical protein [Sphaerochaeta sp.]MCK9603248.1 hypothetical protein [Candidatus Omnitrophota bacterium]